MENQIATIKSRLAEIQAERTALKEKFTVELQAVWDKYRADKDVLRAERDDLKAQLKELRQSKTVKSESNDSGTDAAADVE